MQQLLARGSLVDPAAAAPERFEQNLAVGGFEPWRSLIASEEPLGFADAVTEVRRNDVELRHTRMQPLKRLRVARCRRIDTRLFVVPPQREGEPVSLKDAWLNTRVETRNGASDLGEPPCDLDLKLERLLARERHSGKNITRE